MTSYANLHILLFTNDWPLDFVSWSLVDDLPPPKYDAFVELLRVGRIESQDFVLGGTVHICFRVRAQ
jgi:hypothetical protein